MKPAPTPLNEESRIATLRLLNILDTEPEERFDRLTRMAKKLFSVPIAAITLVDTDRQWFKSSIGLSARETPRDIAFCSHAILGDDVFLVPDASSHESFSDNPLVVGDPNIRFYAGCPLKVGDANLGTLCVIDNKPHEFGEEDLQMLKDLAGMVAEELTAVQLAVTDALTTLTNRRGFEILARHALSVCKRMGRPATLLFFDLNRFKQINDTLGHAAGDSALKTFARGLLTVCRVSDVIGRLGGDEFGVLLTGTGSETVSDFLSRLQRWIEANNRVEETGYAIEFSVGQVRFEPEKNHSIENLLALADSAMYENKRAFRQSGAGH
jgi:diguanylate cyclase (GGDEF)-like protein